MNQTYDLLLLYALVLWLLDIHPIKAQERLSRSEGENPMFEKVRYPKGSIPILNRKIFKGTRVTIREHPYILSIRRKLAHYMVGTLLSKNILISVAHPLFRVPVHELKVVSGENYADRGTTTNSVLLVVIHDDFDPNTLQADIALLRCHEFIIFRDSVKQITLINPDFETHGYIAHVSGWGRCDLTRGTKIGPGMMCAGPARSEDPLAPCMAVPGAALVIHGRLAGLQSWGFGCGYRHDLPIVYTSVKYYVEWILDNGKLLKNITQKQLSQFNQVTKAYELLEWLKLTRDGTDELPDVQQFTIQTVEVDALLARLNGTVYDIRNFLYDQKFNFYKLALHRELKDKYQNKLVNILRTPAQLKTVTLISKPFLNRNNTLFSNISINDEYDGNEQRIDDDDDE